MSEPLRWGIISTGGIARTFANDLRYTESGVAVAVGSRTMEAANQFADRFGIAHRYASYEELVKDPDVDAVYVGTPHPMHFGNATMALEAGKPVLVEKAFTMTSREAIDLVNLARAKRLFLMEAMWTRCLPHVAAVNELIAAGEIGDIVSVEADHGQHFDFDPTSRTAWSVLVTGTAQQVTDPAEILWASSRVHPWVPAHDPLLVKVPTTLVSGRRFQWSSGPDPASRLDV